jgi:hypothetical protein
MTPLETWLGLWSSGGAAAAPGLAAALQSLERFAEAYARSREGGSSAADWEAAARAFIEATLPAASGIAGGTAGADVGALAHAMANAFARRLAAGAPPTSLRAAFDLWVDCAEEAYRVLAASAAFAGLQAAMCNALVRLREQQQPLADQAAALVGLPTRAEVDALHDTVRELRGELERARAPRAARSTRPRKAR